MSWVQGGLFEPVGESAPVGNSAQDYSETMQWHTGPWWGDDGPPHTWDHLGRYTHLVWGPDDPKRTARPPRNTGGRADKRADKTLRKTTTPAELRSALLGHFQAHPGTTFHHACITLWDMEASMAPDVAEAALFALVADAELEHTNQVPIRFRPTSTEG